MRVAGFRRLDREVGLCPRSVGMADDQVKERFLALDIEVESALGYPERVCDIFHLGPAKSAANGKGVGGCSQKIGESCGWALAGHRPTV